MISVTSSLTPGIVENSCRIPSILIDVTAAPGSELRRILLMLFPSVIPYPLSRGSTTNLPYVPSSLTVFDIVGFSISIIENPPFHPINNSDCNIVSIIWSTTRRLNALR